MNGRELSVRDSDVDDQRPRAVFVGDYVTATWVQRLFDGTEASEEDVDRVADAFEGWERVEGEPPGCP